MLLIGRFNLIAIFTTMVSILEIRGLFIVLNSKYGLFLLANDEILEKIIFSKLYYQH